MLRGIQAIQTFKPKMVGGACDPILLTLPPILPSSLSLSAAFPLLTEQF